MTVILCHLLFCPFWLSLSCQSPHHQILGVSPMRQARWWGGWDDTTWQQQHNLLFFCPSWNCRLCVRAAFLFSSQTRAGWRWAHLTDVGECGNTGGNVPLPDTSSRMTNSAMRWSGAAQTPPQAEAAKFRPQWLEKWERNKEYCLNSDGI